MSQVPLLIVILAAGKGTRMRSALPKVLHPVAGRSLLGHVIAAARGASAARIAVVVGPGMDDVRKEAERQAPGAEIFVQTDQRGTADAVLAARPALAAHSGNVIVLFGDTPLLTPATIAAAKRTMRRNHRRRLNPRASAPQAAAAWRDCRKPPFRTTAVGCSCCDHRTASRRPGRRIL